MVEIIPNWHPLFVHFTVALISVSGGLFVLTKLVTNGRVEDQWLATAYWTLWIGVLISLGTVAAGWYAFNTVDHDTPSHEAMIEHRNLALVTLVVLVIMGVWSLVQYLKERSPSLIFVACMLVSVGLVGSTGWHGGELVYRYGLGVKSLPKKEKHDHQHAQEPGASDTRGHDAAVPPAGEAAAPAEKAPHDDGHAH